MDLEAPLPMIRTSSADKPPPVDAAAAGLAMTTTDQHGACDPYLTFSTLPAEFTLNRKVWGLGNVLCCFSLARVSRHLAKIHL